ncbi:MAG: hypothetical protein AB7U82_04215 [Blastocatellales bacterium]
MNFTKHKIGAALLGVALLTLSHCDCLTSAAAAQSEGIRVKPVVVPAGIRVKRAVIPAGSNGRFLQLAFVRDKRARVTINGGASATVNGVTISSLAINEAGAVRALVSTDCDATDARFTLRAAIGRDTLARAVLRVLVLNNPPPTLSYDEAQIVAPGGKATIKPASGPARGLSDQGRIASVTVRRVTPRFKGRIEVDEQGVVNISKAPSRGSFKVTIRAADDCGEYTDASFTLQVAVTNVPIAQTREGGIVRSARDEAETGESQPAEPAAGEGKKKKTKEPESANEEVKKDKTKKRDAVNDEAANDEAAEPEVKKAKAKKRGAAKDEGAEQKVNEAKAKKDEAKNGEAKPEKVKKATEDKTIK